MANKMKSIFNILILATVSLLLIASASASLIDVSKSDITFTKSQNVTNFDITAHDNTILQITNTLVLVDDLGNSLSFKVSSSTLNFPVVNATTINVSYISNEFEFRIQDYDVGQITIFAMNASDHSINETYTINAKILGSLCEFGTVGHISITEVSDDSDEWTWHPLEEITLSVEVENNYDDSKKIKIKPELYDVNGKKINLNIQEKSVNIDDSDSDIVDFLIKVPADVKSGSFRLYVKAYLSSGGEGSGCDDKWQTLYYQALDIEKDDYNVVIDLDALESSMPFIVSCNQDVSFSLPIYNIGDYKEDSVKVLLKNKELGVLAEKTFENMHIGDYQTADFEFFMPSNATFNKVYLFDLITYFDYDDYDNTYSGSNSYSLKFKAGTDCKVVGDVTMSIALDSQQVMAGKEVKINTTLTNPTSASMAYSISVEGLGDWATVKSVSPQTITLAPNEKKTVITTLQLDDSAAGDKTFSIKVAFGGQAKTQAVSMFVNENSASIFGNIKNWFGSDSWVGQHWSLLLIILVNVVLIAVIIFLAIKLSK